MTNNLIQIDNACIADPLTGEQIEVSNVDAMAEAYDRMEQRRTELEGAMKAIRIAIAALSAGDAKSKTRRVRGERHTVKIELPDAHWDQSALKTAWEQYPELAREYVRIERFAPKLREITKLRNTEGSGVFPSFKALVLGAEQAPTALPRITIETDTSRELSEQEGRITGAMVASLKRGA